MASKNLFGKCSKSKERLNILFSHSCISCISCIYYISCISCISRSETTDAILYSILIPNGLFVFSVVVLVYWSDHPISFSNLNFVKSQISQNDNLDDLALDFNFSCIAFERLLESASRGFSIFHF